MGNVVLVHCGKSFSYALWVMLFLCIVGNLFSHALLVMLFLCIVGISLLCVVINFFLCIIGDLIPVHCR